MNCACCFMRVRNLFFFMHSEELLQNCYLNRKKYSYVGLFIHMYVCNFVFCFTRVCHVQGRTQIEDDWKTGSVGEYLYLRGMKCLEAGGKCTVRSLIINLYFSSNIIRMIKPRRMRWAGHLARMGRWEMRTVFYGMSEEETSLGRPRRRREDNSKMDLWEVGWEGVDCIHLAQGRDRWWALVNKVYKL
jgi:hypothetical protein